INYEKEALTFYSRLPRAVLREMSTSDLVKFPMTLAGGKIPILPNLTIKGRKVAAWIDTGANFNIGMSESDAKQLGLKELDFPNGKSTASGSRGVFEIRRVHVLDMAVGPLKKDSVVGITHNQGMSNVVGNAFFKDYVLTLDYIDRMVYLESGK
ncbi:MAG: retropepsin-like aspartic protease, partial [Cyclobacteriaceae bacterium]